MQRRGLSLSFVSVILGVFLINFASAQFYGEFGLSNILNSIDPSTMILGLVFVITFALLNFSLSKVFRDNKTIGGVIAFAVSIGIIYWINRTGLDFEGFFFNFFFFIPEEILYTLIPFILLGLVGFITYKAIKKWGMFKGIGITLILIGVFLMAISLIPNFIYKIGVLSGIGFALFVIGLIILFLGRKKKHSVTDSNSQIPRGTGTVDKSYFKAHREKRIQEKQRQRSEEKLRNEMSQ